MLKDAEAEEARLDAEYGEPDDTVKDDSEDRTIPISAEVIEEITKQAKEVFEKGEDAIVQAQKDSFKKFMKLELQYKANEENLEIKEEADMEKQKFELLKTKIAFVRKEDAFVNPEKAKARQDAIIKKQEDEEKAKEEREQIPPAEEVALIENFQKAAASTENPDEAIKTLIDDQKALYSVAMVELKKAAIDTTKTKDEKVALETKVAIEQKKYLALQQEVVKIEDKKIEAKKIAD